MACERVNADAQAGAVAGASSGGGRIAPGPSRVDPDRAAQHDRGRPARSGSPQRFASNPVQGVERSAQHKPEGSAPADP